MANFILANQTFSRKLTMKLIKKESEKMIYFLRIAYLLGWVIVFPLMIFAFAVDIFLNGLILSSLSYIIYGNCTECCFLISSFIETYYRSLEPKNKEKIN